MDFKFAEAVKAAETLTLDLDIAKTAWKTELKKMEGDEPPIRQLKQARLPMIWSRRKGSRRQREMKLLSQQSLQAKQHSTMP